ncbi:MAG: hypothetical protein L6V93_21280 [Clostridiales bacterium]|nr:MAG: hypothetical protein L6V93_21280 [Clostridiales bacterium]
MTDITLSPSNTAFAASALDYSDGALKKANCSFSTRRRRNRKITDANENFTQIEFIGRSKKLRLFRTTRCRFIRRAETGFGNILSETKTVFLHIKIKDGKNRRGGRRQQPRHRNAGRFDV